MLETPTQAMSSCMHGQEITGYACCVGVYDMTHPHSIEQKKMDFADWTMYVTAFTMYRGRVMLETPTQAMFSCMHGQQITGYACCVGVYDMTHPHSIEQKKWILLTGQCTLRPLQSPRRRVMLETPTQAISSCMHGQEITGYACCVGVYDMTHPHSIEQKKWLLLTG